jgi:hypothetical protein
MAYIGRGLDKISNVEVLDNITFDGSSTSFTLQKGGVNFTPSSANNILVSIDGVVQAGNFTCSGSTIDFGVAVSASSTCNFIIHYGVGVITEPSDNSVTAAKIPNGVVSNAHLAGSIDLTSKVTGTLPLGNGGIGATTLAGAGIKNSAHFSVRISGSGSTGLAHATTTVIPFASEEYDPDGVFNTSTYKFTAPSAGKYYFNWCVRKSNFTAARFYIDILKNDSGIATFENGGGSVYGSIGGSIVVDLAQNDTMHAVMYQNDGSTQQISNNNTRFCGFKLV